MDFSPPPRCKSCMICKKEIPLGAPTAEVQKQSAHKECFKCSICDCELIQGQCSQDIALAKTDFLRSRGPLWFCRNHMMLGAGEKMELLKKKTK
uniref:LIM zinc-binding domain-containing protein n=1 Tax=Panagrolaimus davidi TaxID=227884 RepID=A0A914PQL6_9BILA